MEPEKRDNMKIESRIGKSSQPAEALYTYVSDFRNFEQFLPEDQVSDWESEATRCSFRIASVGRVAIRIIETTPASLIKIASEPEGSSQNFTLWIQFKEISENDTRIKITVEPRVNSFVLGMIKSQLKAFVDSLVTKMEDLKVHPG
jgi:uncharacterized membrane protein